MHEMSQTSDAAAESTADRKTKKYLSLTLSYLFVPVAADTTGAINKYGIDFLGDLGRRITRSTDYHYAAREPSLSGTLRFNSTLRRSHCLGYLHPHNTEDEM